MDITTISTYLLEIFYIFIGLFMAITMVFTLKDKNHKTRIGTAAFWGIVSAMFLFGKFIPSTILGALFTAAGVGDTISNIISNVIPKGNALVGVIAYCLGMAIFTAIMGNAFASFSVITVGIGVPFVFMQGGNPVICGTLAMTAGFCGTLLTPMAANFNMLPSALLEMKDKNGVIKAQAPFAIILLIVHIILMYTLGFL